MSTSTAKKTENKDTPKLRIKLRAYDHRILDKSSQQIIDMAQRCGAKVLGPIPLPVEITKYTVNRSTFVHKSSREQFEMRVHKRLIDILVPNQKVVESLKTLTLPAGVDTEIKSII
ncbi:MAG: 30S ribosomal protein S10 [Candidatus Paceibacterota bacterium]